MEWTYVSDGAIAVGVAVAIWVTWRHRKTKLSRVERGSQYGFLVLAYGWLITSAFGVDWPRWVDWTTGVACFGLIVVFLVQSMLWLRRTRRDHERLLTELLLLLPPRDDEPPGEGCER